MIAHFALAAYLVVQPAAIERGRVAVLDIVAVDVDASVASAATEILATQLVRNGYETVSSKDVTALVSLEERKLVIGASDSRATERIAQLLSARFVVAGTLTRLGANMQCTVQMMDHKTGAILNRVTTGIPSAAEVNARISALVPELLAEPGRLVLGKQIDGARLYIDDEFVAVLPTPPLPLTREGEHQLRIDSDDYPTWRREFSIARGHTTKIRIDAVSFERLRERADARRLTGAVLVGTGAALAAGAAVFFVSAAQTKQRYDALDLLLVQQSELDAQARLGTGLAIGGWVSAALAASLVTSGVFLLLYNPDADALRTELAELTLGVSANGVQASGRF